MITILLAGFLLGMRHALDPDHLAAMATLTVNSDSRRESLLLGAVWGMGHTLTLVAVCSVVLLLGTEVPPGIEQALEALVGAMLILLGFDLLRRMIRERMHLHAHRHPDGTRHLHVHSHREDVGHPSVHVHTHSRRFPLRALYVGLMHGLAGSAALIVLSLGSVTSPLAGLGYVLVFGVGSIAGMALLTVVISVPLRSLDGGSRTMHVVKSGVAVGTMLVGISLMLGLPVGMGYF